MISRRSVLSSLSRLAMLVPFTASRVAAQSASLLPSFHRGINVSHAFGWADVQADGSYVVPPFSGPRFQFTPEEQSTIKVAGFDFVRLAIDVGPFIALVGTQRDQLDNSLINTVRDLLNANLGVIVDLHPSAMNPAYTPAALTAGVNTPNFQAVLGLLTRLAGRLTQLAGERGASQSNLALELMNEPEMPTATWQPMLEAAYTAARNGSATLPLVLGGGSQYAPDALAQIDMRPFARDARLIYTYHDYSPWQFTQQGVPGNPAYALDGVVYPAPASADAMTQATDLRIAALGLTGADLQQAQQAEQTLASYVSSGFNRSTLERTFRRVTVWRKVQGLPANAILLGEFGLHKTPFEDTVAGATARETWLRDMRQLADTYGFAWSPWTYLGTGGFALAADENGPGFDASTTRALGLNPT